MQVLGHGKSGKKGKKGDGEKEGQGLLRTAKEALAFDMPVPPAPFSDACCERDCQRKATHSCVEVLPCGHRCFGTLGCHSTGGCPPCLVEDCVTKRKQEQDRRESGEGKEDGPASGAGDSSGSGGSRSQLPRLVFPRGSIEKASASSSSSSSSSEAASGERVESDEHASIDPNVVAWGEELDAPPPDRLEEGDEYCKLCFTESLANAPCVTLNCGHVVHARCALKRLLVGQAGHRLTFRYLDCHEAGCTGSYASLASTTVHSPVGLISQVAKKRWALFQHVRGNGLERWDQHLKYAPEALKGGRFHGKQAEHALARLAYYSCSECDRPFFGGAAQCGNALDDEEDQGNDDVPQGGEEGGRGAVDRDNKLLCPTCMGPSVGLRSCPKHGPDDMQMKCMFCCTPAVWFCWGRTYFCEPCHTR